MKLEKLKIVDSVNHKTVHVMVTPELAKRCRTDSSFVMNLLNNVKTGSTFSSTPVKTEHLSQEGISEITPDIKCSWSNFETQKLIEFYAKHKRQFELLPRRTVWTTIAGELSKFGVIKTPEKCDEKWRNLIRTFKSVKNSDRKHHGKFLFYKAVDDAINSSNYIKPKVEVNKSFDFDNVWTYNETKALIEIYEENEDEINVKNKEWPKFWAMVSGNLSERGIEKTAEQCENKWKKMEEKYTKYKKGRMPEKFEFCEEFDRIYGDNIPEDEENSVDNDHDENEDDSMINATANTYELLEALDKYVLSKDNATECNEKNADSMVTVKGEQKSDEDGGFMEDLLSDADGGEGQDGKIFWSREETIKLIMSYKKHKEEFKTCVRKRSVWQTISEELTSEGIAKSAERCETKWKNLLRTYKRLNASSSFDNKATRFMFYQEISDAIDKHIVDEKKESNASMVIKQEKMETSEANTSWNVNLPWTYAETQALLEVYEKHRNRGTCNFDVQFWRAISDELEEEKGIFRDPKACEQKMKNLEMQYKVNFSAGGSHLKMKFYDELKRIFQNTTKTEVTTVVANNSVVTNSEEPKQKKICKCKSTKDLARQKRHEERMSLLRKKVELEERKVDCFERYIELLQRKDVDESVD